MLIIKNAEDLDSQRGGLRLAAPRDFDSQPWCRESSSPALWVEVLFWRGKSRSLWTKLRIQLKLNTALLSTFRASVTGVTSHISHIYKGINAMLIIRGPIKPCIFWIKIILAIFLAKTRPDKAIFSDLTNLTLNYQKYKCWIRIVYFVLFASCLIQVSLFVASRNLSTLSSLSFLFLTFQFWGSCHSPSVQTGQASFEEFCFCWARSS